MAYLKEDMAAHLARVCLALLLGLLLYCSTTAQAITLDKGSARVPLAGHLSLLYDSSGALSFNQVASSAHREQFQHLPGHVSLGFIKGNVWLRFELTRTSGAESEWWLEVPNPLIDDVSLFVPGFDVASSETGYKELKAGEQIPRGLSDSVSKRQVVFSLQLPDEQAHTLYLRLNGGVNAVVTRPTVWTPEEFTHFSSREDLLFGALIGLLTTITLTGFLVGAAVRDMGVLASAALSFSLLLILLPNEGYPQLYLNQHPGLPDVMIGIGLALNFIVGWEILVILGGLGAAAPYIARNMRWPIYLIATPTLLLSFLGYYGDIAPLILMFGQIEGLFVIAISLILAARGNRDAKIFIIPYSAYIVFSLIRLGRNLGWLPANEFTQYAFHMAVLVQAISLAGIATYRLHRLRADREEAKQRELLFARQNEMELEVLVRERTAALKRSMENQRQLLSMVAHEFRNPLAVVDGAAQNISRGIGGSMSVQQIRRAVDRMSQLLVNVLAEDRLTTDLQQPDRLPIELVSLARDCLDFHASTSTTPITLRSHGPEAFVLGDPYLLRILLDNLLNNALKYAPGQPVELVVKAASLHVSDEQDAWLLAVRDEGEGIPKDTDIFAKFVRGQVPAGTAGAGLGLFLVDRISSLHGGKVKANRLSPRGSEVGVVLPKAPRPAAATALPVR